MDRKRSSGAEFRKEKQRKLSAATAGTRDLGSWFKVPGEPTSSSADGTASDEPSVSLGEPTTSDIDNMVSGREPEPIPDDNDEPSSPVSAAGDNPESTELVVTAVERDAPVDVLRPAAASDITYFDSARQYPTDRGHYPGTPLSSDLRQLILDHGPCQPMHINDQVEQHYTFRTRNQLEIRRSWLCYSPSLQKPYCEVCWLFHHNPKKRNWIDGATKSNPRDGWKKRICEHERSDDHIAATRVYHAWKEHRRIDQATENTIRREHNVWRQVLMRLINIILTLSVMAIAFRGHTEKIGDGVCEGGNFLALVAMQAKFDEVLQHLISLPNRATRYLSASVQNELIQLLSSATRNSLLRRIKECPFYSVILDTTSDISRTDQLSVVVRWVELTGIKPVIHETFLGFVVVTDSSARGITTTVTSFLAHLDLQISKVRGQGYDGASVMSGVHGGVQKIFRDSVADGQPVPFVHCASHNLNLVLNDAVRAVSGSIGFFDTLEAIYTFFGGSLNRWAELALTAAHSHDLTIKKLTPTRWSSRISSVRAVKNRYTDIVKVLISIGLKSTTPKERADAAGLKAKMVRFEFILMLVLWERILTSVNAASVQLQSVEMDLSKATRLLSMALSELKLIRSSWSSIVLTSTKLASSWGVGDTTFRPVRQRRTLRFFEELANDQRVQEPGEAFRVHTFLPIIDTAIGQLERRFEGHKLIADTFAFLYPEKLKQMTTSDLEVAAQKLVQTYSHDLSEDLIQEVRSFRNEFRNELGPKETVLDLLKLISNAKLASSMPELTTACLLFLSIPVTVASAERSFSKLKIIKSYLRSSMAQERLAGLAILSIESQEAKTLNYDKLVDEFASKKSRATKFDLA
jgi:hypothetical protein